MGSYYYLIAQLPFLTYGQQAPMSSQAFKDLVIPGLGHDDSRSLSMCNLAVVSANRLEETDPLGTKITSQFVRNWFEWEDALRLNLAKIRSQKFKRENTDQKFQDAPEYPADAAAAAKTAAAMDSPLEAELFLDRARWNAIDSFGGIDYFNENTIFAYHLKLQIMERGEAFNMEEGFTEYKTLYASILENAGEPK